jgi:hypothetical protein
MLIYIYTNTHTDTRAQTHILHTSVTVSSTHRVRDGVRADTRLMQARPAASRSASPVFESSEGGEESAYDDRMSLDHLCATCRAARVHACRASDHSGEPAASSGVSFLSPSPHSAVGADGGAPAFHADPLTRLCLQMEAPRQSLHRPLRRLCSQMEAPPQSLHELLCRLCSQMGGPLQSLHELLLYTRAPCRSP